MTSPFTKHVLISSHVDDAVGTWLCQQLYSDGKPDSCFWFRITAAEGHLSVVGDFNPTVFAYGPRSPIETIRWIGRHPTPDGYVMQKAGIGMGDRRQFELDVDLAVAQLTELLKDEEAMSEMPSEQVEWLTSIAECRSEYSGALGVHDLLLKISEAVEGNYDFMEYFNHFGERPTQDVCWALQAISRLVELLNIETESVQ